MATNTKKTAQRQGFKTGEYIVYPAHGVGQITAIEEQNVAGHSLELLVIVFEQDKMTLRVPVAKIASVGMRKLGDPAAVKKALETVQGRPRIKRTMWSRRAQEYEAKINSGDLIAISEVVRDLFRSESQPGAVLLRTPALRSCPGSYGARNCRSEQMLGNRSNQGNRAKPREVTKPH